MPESLLKHRLLESYPILQGTPDHLLDQVRLMAIPAHTVVFDENQPCQGFPLVLSGGVRVAKVSPNGRELQLYRVDAGESCILTSSCLLGHTPYQARGTTESATELALLPAKAFHTLLADNAKFRSHIFQLFAERIADLMTLVSAVAFQKLDQRLAALLINRPTPLHITHQALADELGSVREMITRLLKQFAEQGWVKLGRENIEVLDTAALRRYSSL
jgi:CRP/FNR family transcriptional regulator